MGDQMDIFEVLARRPAPRVRGCDTSEAAAEAIEPTAGTLRARVLGAIRGSADGHTCDELEVLLDLPHQTCSARVYELRRSGHIVDSGERRKTRSGRGAIVWVTVTESS